MNTQIDYNTSEIKNKKIELENEITKLLDSFSSNVCPIDKVIVEICKHYKNQTFESNSIAVGIKLFL